MEDIEHGISEHDTNKRGNTEHEITGPETAQDANTEGPEEGDPASDSTAVAAPGWNNCKYPTPHHHQAGETKLTIHQRWSSMSLSAIRAGSL